jgi:hypothetical protein
MIEGIFRSETRKHHFSITKERVPTIVINAESFNKDRERKYFCEVFDGIKCAAFDQLAYQLICLAMKPIP